MSRIEMDLAFGSVKPYGSSRSIVRRIGSTLPLAPCPRVCFQLQTFTLRAGAGGVTGAGGHVGGIASLADVGWIGQEESDVSVSDRRRWEADSGLAFRTQQCPPLTRQHSLPSMHQAESTPQSQTLVNDQAIQKISALENELAKLRVQIAQIVQAQERNVQSAAVTPVGPPPHPSSVPPPPPPPPPPPLPPPPPGIHRSISAIDLIKERRSKKADQGTVLESGPRQPEMPNMLDVLKDMGKVKLRSVKNRPDEDHAKASEPADPAALIAEALKRKFAHRYRNNSECENNFSVTARESRPRSETPAFGQHMLKSTGTRKLP